MKDEARFKESMTALGELFDKPLSKFLIDVYWKALEPFSDEECNRAFNEVAISSRFFPKPVDLIEIIQGKKADQSIKAWLKVIEAVRRVGLYKSVKFNDPVIHSVFQFWGGWASAADWDDSELKWKQKEFERLYVIMTARGEHPSYLPGIHEIHNAAAGFDVKSHIVEIGFNEDHERIAAA